MANLPSNQNQLPDRSIMDHYNRLRYLGQQFVLGMNGYSPGATSETNALIIQNPISNANAQASGIYGRQTIGAFLDFRKICSTTASETVVAKFYLNPTFSGGTPQTPINCRTAYTNASVMNLLLSPTVSAKGTFLDSLESNAFVPSDSHLLYILDPGQSMLMTITAGSAPTTLNSLFSWYEL